MPGTYSVRFERIFHPTDFSHGSDIAFAHALKLVLETQGELEIVHVDKDAEQTNWRDFPSVRETLVRWNVLKADATNKDVAGTGAVIDKVNAQGKDVGETILKYANKFAADLVVLATHRRDGFDRWLHKEIASKVASKTAAAALFVPYGVDGFVNFHDGSVALRNILIPICHQPKPQIAVDAAAWIAESLDSKWARFTSLHIGDESELPSAATHKRASWAWHWETRAGDVVEEIISASKDHSADLIVMTTQGPDGFLDAIRGSTTEQVLQRASCPVLAVQARHD